MSIEHMKEKVFAIASQRTDVNELQFIRDHPDDVEIIDISDVWMNDVVRVSLSGDTSKAVVFKYAPPFVKFLGPDVPVTQYRALAEFNSYTYFERVCPGSVPRPYCYSAEHNTLAVEFLDGYGKFREQLQSGVADWAVIDQIARTIGRVHLASHRVTLGPSDFEKLQQKFPTSKVNDLLGYNMFDDWLLRENPYHSVEGEILNYALTIYNDEEILANVAKFKDMYYNQKDCLVHYDMHAGSVMVKGSVMKIMDNEFSTVGAAPLDIAQLSTHLIFNKIRQTTIFTDDIQTHHKIADDMFEAFVHLMEAYLETISPCFSDGSDASANRSQFVSEMAGFMACSMCERILGRIRAREVDRWDAARMKVLRLAVDLLRRYREIRCVQQLADFIRLAE